MTDQARRRVFYGWWVVAAATAISFYSSGVFFYGFGPFFNPILDEFGWSRASTSIVFAMRSMEMGALAPLFGFLVDRFGARRLMSLGAIVAGVGFLLMSQINSLGTFVGAFAVLTLGFDAVMGVVTMTAVSQWFVRRRGLALGILSAGAGFSGLVVPLITLLIGQTGWRWAFALLGVGLWAFVLPLAFLVIRDRPEARGLFPDGDPAPAGGASTRDGRDPRDFTLRQALGSRSFWFLSLAFGVVGATMNALVAHQMPYFISIGYSRSTSSLLIAAMTAISAVGRPGFGWLADRLSKRYLLVVLCVFQGIGLLVFAELNGPAWQVALFLFTFGPAYGAINAFRGMVFADYFGRSSLGAVLGAVSLVTTVGSALSPVYTGAVFDTQGSYRPAFLLMGVITFGALPLALLSFKPRKKVPEREPGMAEALET